MKHIWGLVGSAGGAGCNPEQWAIKGYLRSVALMKVRMKLAAEKTQQIVFLQPAIASKFCLQRRRHQCTHNYVTALQLMFAGNIGSAIARSFRDGTGMCNDAVFNQLRSMSLHELHFFDTIYNEAHDPAKCFRTYDIDANRSGHLGVPRVGSRIFVRGVPDSPPMLIQLMVGRNQTRGRDKRGDQEGDKMSRETDKLIHNNNNNNNR
jgi:hypothetical protein